MSLSSRKSRVLNKVLYVDNKIGQALTPNSSGVFPFLSAGSSGGGGGPGSTGPTGSFSGIIDRDIIPNAYDEIFML